MQRHVTETSFPFGSNPDKAASQGQGVAGALEPSGCSSGPSCAFPPSDGRAASFGRPVLGPDDRPAIGGNYMVVDVCVTRQEGDRKC